VYEPTNGRVSFLGRPMVENHPQGKMVKDYQGENQGMFTQVISPTPDKITQLGIARTFQNIRLFSALSVFDNVLIAKHMRAKQNVFSATSASTAPKRSACGRRPWPCWIPQRKTANSEPVC